MAEKKSAGTLAEQPACKVLNEITPIIPQEPDGRELLQSFAADIAALCNLVQLWLTETDRLRARVAELERRQCCGGCGKAGA